MLYSNDVYLLDIANARYTSSNSFVDIDIYDIGTYNNNATLDRDDYKTIASRVCKIIDVAEIDFNSSTYNDYLLGVLLQDNKGNRILCRATDLVYSDRRLYHLDYDSDGFPCSYVGGLVHSRFEDNFELIDYLISSAVYRISNDLNIHKKIQGKTFVDTTYVSEPTPNRFYLNSSWKLILDKVLKDSHRGTYNYAQCTCCNSITNRLETYGNEKLCHRCYHTREDKCDSCHANYTPQNLIDIMHIDNSDLRLTYLDLSIKKCCKTCFQKITISCNHCRCSDVVDFDKLRDLIHRQDRRDFLTRFQNRNNNYHYVMGSAYCISCADLKLHSYLANPFRYRRLPNRLANKSEFNRFIGIESEVMTQYDDADEYYDSCGNPSHFEVISDGSLNAGGVEFVTSKPIIGSSVDVALDSLENANREDDNFVDDRCGVHIHMNALDFNFTEIQSLLMIMSRIQGYIYRGLPSERSDNTYCKEIPMTPRQISRMSNLTYLVNEYYKCANEVLTDNKYNDARYFGTNVHARFYLGTIEFRYHEGTVYSKPIREWIQFLNRIMTASTKLHKNPILCSKIISNKAPTMDILRDVTGVSGAEYIDRRINNN